MRATGATEGASRRVAWTDVGRKGQRGWEQRLGDLLGPGEKLSPELGSGGKEEGGAMCGGDTGLGRSGELPGGSDAVGLRCSPGTGVCKAALATPALSPGDSRGHTGCVQGAWGHSWLQG